MGVPGASADRQAAAAAAAEVSASLLWRTLVNQGFGVRFGERYINLCFGERYSTKVLVCVVARGISAGEKVVANPTRFGALCLTRVAHLDAVLVNTCSKIVHATYSLFTTYSLLFTRYPS